MEVVSTAICFGCRGFRWTWKDLPGGREERSCGHNHRAMSWAGPPGRGVKTVVVEFDPRDQACPRVCVMALHGLFSMAEYEDGTISQLSRSGSGGAASSDATFGSLLCMLGVAGESRAVLFRRKSSI